MDDPRLEFVEEAVSQIMPILSGLGSDVQGAVLAELVSMYLAGHHPMIREETMEFFIRTTKALVAPNEAILFEHTDKPEGWNAS